MFAHLLLEVPPIFFVNKDKIEIIARAELLVYISERWCKVEAAKE